ncbi:hypothetical protein SAY86_023273 [Trapa natans]|uniref:Uncharacterized protein n=1 Tax=Trapa natans TaxID=22666 RepID=A0AAN7LPQ8_TRANT|nr:hypothetical protein SAY86_023273 [Trapa natans]
MRERVPSAFTQKKGDRAQYGHTCRSHFDLKFVELGRKGSVVSKFEEYILAMLPDVLPEEAQSSKQAPKGQILKSSTSPRHKNPVVSGTLFFSLFHTANNSSPAGSVTSFSIIVFS